jgi:hypothetical protein
MHLIVGVAVAILLFYIFVVKPPKEQEDRAKEKQAETLEASRPLDSFAAPTDQGVGAESSSAGSNLRRPLDRTRQVLDQSKKRAESTDGAY